MGTPCPLWKLLEQDCRPVVMMTSEVRTGYPYELGAEDPFALPPPVIPECPLCSGKVSRDGPAAQALAWGVRVAESAGTSSSFWKGAIASEVARDFDQAHLDGSGMVSVQADAIALSMLGSPSSDSSQTELDASEVELLKTVTASGEYKSPTNREDPWWSSGFVCCVKKFDFPVPNEEEGNRAHLSDARRSRDGEDGRIVSVDFEVDIEFKNDLPCLCECCEYRQWIEKDKLTVRRVAVWDDSVFPPMPKDVEEEEKRFERPPHEDCTWAVWQPGTDGGVGVYSGVHSSPHERPSQVPGTPVDKPVLGPFCTGDRDAIGEHTEKWPGQGAGAGKYTHAECRYHLRDVPREFVPEEHWFRWEIVFVGIIYDRCANWAIRRIKRFNATTEGYVRRSLHESKIAVQPRI